MGTFVAVVVIALVVTSFLPASPQGTQLSFEELALFGGNASFHSYNATCSGAATLEVTVLNPTPDPITIQNVTISGNGVVNATVYVIVSNNSCLTLSEAGVAVPGGSTYQLEGYVNAPLAFASNYQCVIIFSNGQKIDQVLPAGT